MKILWVVNIKFPFVCQKLGLETTVYGGWMLSLANLISSRENIDLAIATLYEGKDIKILKDGKITYYLLPGGFHSMVNYDQKLEYYWQEVIKDFIPNLVHLHGTEFAHGLALLNASETIPSVVSIQGLLTNYVNYFYGGIKFKEIITHMTLRDIIRRDTLFGQRRKFVMRSKFEVSIIKKVKHIIGRTDWDYANTQEINDKTMYYKCNESLRTPFYDKKWSFDSIEPHTIFVSQAIYPIKGFHMLLKAANIVIKKFPDLKIIVAGDHEMNKKWYQISGYGSYLKKLIKKLGLEKNIIFTGPLNSEEFSEKMVTSHISVLSSAIENSPNSLGEAQLMGVPCISSFVGGVPDMIKHDESGLLYQYSEYTVLAHHIMTLFSSREKCEQLSNDAKQIASIRHNYTEIVDNMVNIYQIVSST